MFDCLILVKVMEIEFLGNGWSVRYIWDKIELIVVVGSFVLFLDFLDYLIRRKF